MKILCCSAIIILIFWFIFTIKLINEALWVVFRLRILILSFKLVWTLVALISLFLIIFVHEWDQGSLSWSCSFNILQELRMSVEKSFTPTCISYASFGKYSSLMNDICFWHSFALLSISFDPLANFSLLLFSQLSPVK